MKIASRRIRSFQRASLALLFAIVTSCAFSVPQLAFDGAGFFPGGIAEAQSQEPALRVEVDLQPVDVQVKDSRGNNVVGLSAKDFTVLENGRPQRIAFFDGGNGPLSLVVLVDSSDSMSSEGSLGSAEAIAARFLRTGRPGDEIWAMDFTDQMGPFEQMSREQLLNPSAVTLAPAPSGGSAIYDAIASALCHLRASKNPRQAVIVITDGDDQHSRLTLEQLISLVRSSRAQLFMIGLRSRPEFNLGGHTEPRLTLVNGHDIDNPVVVFDRLMKESGAESFIPNSEKGLNEALKAVSDMLQSEYTLAYYPPRASQKSRKIEVKVDRRGTHVLGGRLVGSDQNVADSLHFDETCAVSPKFHPYPFESKLTHGSNGKIYREDFSDPHSGWPVHKDSHYISGAYELSNPEVEFMNTGQVVPGAPPAEAPTETSTFQDDVVAAYGPWWSDFRASVTMKTDPEKVSHDASVKFLHGSRPAAGLLFRLNLDGYYALLVSGTGEKSTLSVELVRRAFFGRFYTETQLVPWTKVAQSSASGTELSVEAMGSQISIFVDGQEIKSVQDDTYDRGLSGFVISGPGHAIFKNLVVEQK